MAPRQSNNALLLQLVADVGGLKSSVGHVVEAQKRADGKRADVYREIGNCRRDIASLKQDQAVTKDKVVRMEPIVTALDQRHQRRIGAGVSRKQMWIVTSFIVTTLTAIAAKFTALGDFLVRQWPFR